MGLWGTHVHHSLCNCSRYRPGSFLMHRGIEDSILIAPSLAPVAEFGALWCSLVLFGALWCSLVLFACSCASRSESTHRHTPNLQGKRLPANVFHRNTNSSSALIVPKLARDLACIQGLAQPSHLLFITSTLSPPAHLNAARWD